MHGVQSCEGGVGETVASFIVESSWESAWGREEERQKVGERLRTRTHTQDAAGFVVFKVGLIFLRLYDSIRPCHSHLAI